MRVAVALLALALAAAAGCGGGGSSDSSSGKRSINAESQRRAKAMQLRLADFPDGWRASAPDPEDKKGAAKFRKCVGVDFSSQNVTGHATSRDFATGETTSASSEATVLGGPAQAQDRFEQAAASMNGPKVKDCVTKLIPGSSDYKLGDVDVGELRISQPGNVERAKGWQIVIPLEVTSGASQGISATVYADLVALLNNDAVATVSTFDVLTPFDSTLRDQLVTTVAERMT